MDGSPVSGDRARSASWPLEAPAWQCLWRELFGYLRHGLGLETPRGVGLYLLDSGELAYRTGSSLVYGSGRVLGCYIDQIDRCAVLIDRSLPLELGSEVLAHELAHAWQARHCPRGQSEILREGFAQWVAFRYCGWAGFTRQQRKMRHHDDAKGQGLRSLLALERVVGPLGVVARVRSARRLREVIAGLPRTRPQVAPYTIAMAGSAQT